MYSSAHTFQLELYVPGSSQYQTDDDIWSVSFIFN